MTADSGFYQQDVVSGNQAAELLKVFFFLEQIPAGL